jgi:hypothetical protein
MDMRIWGGGRLAVKDNLSDTFTCANLDEFETDSTCDRNQIKRGYSEFHSVQLKRGGQILFVSFSFYSFTHSGL